MAISAAAQRPGRGRNFELTSAAAGSRTGQITVAGAVVGYVDMGTATDRDTLVLLPGTGGRTETHFSYLAPMLAAKGRVVGIDFGPTPDRALTVDDLVAQTIGVLDELDLNGPIALCGYSLGAVVAAAVAAELRDQIAALVLVAGWSKTDVHQMLRNAVWHGLRQGGSDSLRDFMTFCAFSAPYLRARTPAELQALPTRFELTELMDAQMDLTRRVDIADRLEDVVAPTLVVGCTHDQMVPVRHSKLLFGSIADARYAEVVSGHAVVTERPAELCRLIDRFVVAPSEIPAGEHIPAQTP